MKGIISKIKIPYNKTNQEPPYHKGIASLSYRRTIYGKFKIYPNSQLIGSLASLIWFGCFAPGNNCKPFSNLYFAC